MTLEQRVRRGLENSTGPLIVGDATAMTGNDPAAFRPAAVLIGLIEHADPTVLLTVRTDHLTRHAGQVAFPGGRIDPADSDAVAAALREADEEVGLSRRDVRVLGELAPYRTGTGYQVTPVVGIIPPGIVLDPDPGEVAAIFEVPLSIALDPARYALRSVEWKGATRHYYELYHHDFRIWGATASMLVNLGHMLQWVQP